MNEHAERLVYYRNQLELCQKQDAILAEIQEILFKMKELAECSVLNLFTEEDKLQANLQLNEWTGEIQLLEVKLRSGSLLN
ncbi:hypothetical protein ACQCT3_01715 [Sutcliffiella horikoshii]|uniref:hypothetical protein n=1 Tax=Sutcliffiella horikoshii TaxID=79883 RepID=UPI003CEF9AB5